jgi:hypothetical protein
LCGRKIRYPVSSQPTSKECLQRDKALRHSSSKK